MNNTDEVWKPVKIEVDFEYTNEVNLEISNYGQIRNTTTQGGQRIIKGTFSEGYRVVKIKLLKERSEKTQVQLDYLRDQIIRLKHKLTDTRKKFDKTKNAEEKAKMIPQLQQEKELLDSLNQNYKKLHRAELLKRTTNRTFLIHRLVAEAFCEGADEVHNLVIHKDYNKLNNRHTNLKWVDQEESTAHQLKSPYVIEEKLHREKRTSDNATNRKLSSTQVMFIKKKINEGVPLRTLAKTFKVTETQLSRIKNGVNWKEVKAAE